MSGEGFTEDEVAERVGTTPEIIRRLSDLGIIESDEGVYPRRAVLRARVVLDSRWDGDRCRCDRASVGVR